MGARNCLDSMYENIASLLCMYVIILINQNYPSLVNDFSCHRDVAAICKSSVCLIALERYANLHTCECHTYIYACIRSLVSDSYNVWEVGNNDSCEGHTVNIDKPDVMNQLYV